MSSTSPLVELPNEVLQNILTHCDALDAIALERCCHRFRDVTHEPLLWKIYCQRKFRYWDRRHRLKTKLLDIGFSDWKQLYANRWRSNEWTCKALDQLISRQYARLDSIQIILDAGYDAKDILKGVFDISHEFSDHLARKYWCHAALGCVHRSVGLEQWADLRSPDADQNLMERCLAALDMFILEEQDEGDINDIFQRLDSYTAKIRKAYPDIDEIPTRRKASIIAEFLTQRGWVGINSDRHYHSLDHMFLGVALFSQSHDSIPLVSVVIYCYVARQLNLRASPINYPFRVHAVIQPPEGFDLDGRRLPPDAPRNDDHLLDPRTHLFIDPFNSSEAITISTLETQLRFIASTADREKLLSYLTPATATDMTIRAATNILQAPTHYDGPTVHPINKNLAAYAGLFAGLVVQHQTTHPMQLRQRLVMLTQHCLEYFELDLNLMRKYILPLTNRVPDAPAYEGLIESLRAADLEKRSPKRHSTPVNAVVKYHVGQVFRHRLRGYVAVIYGWDPTCKMQEQWITLNQVDRLPNGRHQPFYNVLVDDESTRYVAQENVILLSPGEITTDILERFPIEIGKWFKRYDPERGVYISNIREEYPED